MPGRMGGCMENCRGRAESVEEAGIFADSSASDRWRSQGVSFAWPPTNHPIRQASQDGVGMDTSDEAR